MTQNFDSFIPAISIDFSLMGSPKVSKFKNFKAT